MTWIHFDKKQAHMRKYFNAKLFVILAVLMAVACDEALHLSPKTSLNSKVVFDTPERILGLVNGMYKTLKSADFYGQKYPLLMDVRGEEFINVSSNPVTEYLTWSNALTSGDMDTNNLWTAAYLTINNANILIAGLENSADVITDSLRNNYIAEAYFVRALCYYE